MVNSKTLRIVYMGTPEFAVAPLKLLIDNGYNIVAAITVPDKPAGRGQKLQQSAVKTYAQSVNIPVLQPIKLKDAQFLEELKSFNADLFIVVAFRMLPQEVWQMPQMGTFNLHASLLPQYRGAAPINWAIINGETKTGVTTFFIDKEIDTGKILFNSEVEITNDDNAETLHDKLMNVGANLVIKTVDAIAKGDITPQKQICNTELKSAPKIFNETCKINWSKTPQEIYNLIRGLSPYPAAWCEIICDEKSTIKAKIYAAQAIEEKHNLTLGTILSNGKTDFKIACNGGFINIKEIKNEGKKRLKINDFLAGFRNIKRCKIKI